MAAKKEKNSKDLEKAMNLIKNDKIAKLNPEDENLQNHYIVTGSRDDYLVILPEYCTCEQFILRCLKEPGKICYHILATRMSSKVRAIVLDDWIDLLLREH